MIDLQSTGIRRVFRIQKERYFPLPDYDLSNRQQVKVCVYGKILDENLKVIEGKMPNIFLSAAISETLGEKNQYVKNKTFDDQYYKDLIVKYLEQYGKAKKKDIRTLLWNKLPEVMTDKQKEDKIRNLLFALRRKTIIITDSKNQQRSSWILVSQLK